MHVHALGRMGSAALTEQPDAHDAVHALGHVLHGVRLGQQVHLPLHQRLPARDGHGDQPEAGLEVQEGGREGVGVQGVADALPAPAAAPVTPVRRAGQCAGAAPLSGGPSGRSHEHVLLVQPRQLLEYELVCYAEDPHCTHKVCRLPSLHCILGASDLQPCRLAAHQAAGAAPRGAQACGAHS